MEPLIHEIGDATDVLAEEFVVMAKVLQATPQFEVSVEQKVSADCRQGKPQGRNLTQLVAWDLQQDHCLESVKHERLTGYQVEYEWNGGARSMVMLTEPGESVPIKVSIR